MDAHSLRCPQCGAATRSGAARCPYCRARLATVGCPACFSLMFEDSLHCPRCGVRRARLEEAADARCPGCRAGLQGVVVGDVRLLECTACDGLWLDAEAFERICADRESQAAVLHRGRTRAPGIEKRVSYRPCVRCGTMMNRVNFARLSGTIVDLCRGHGTFLDAGELQAIVAFIQSGGLQRARQRQIEDVKEQERSLRGQEVRLAASRRGTATWNGWYQTGTGFADLLTLFSGD